MATGDGCCPTCGRHLPRPRPPRKRTCWACGKTFEQRGYGRTRILCGQYKCERKRWRYRRGGQASLDRMEDS